MHSISLIALLVLIAGASSQCFGGNCGGCFGNNCGPRVSVIRLPNNNRCSCNPCFGNGCAPRCSYCPNNFGYSSCCNNNNFSCCGYGYRYRRQAISAAASDVSSN
ncbi:hypothetical protein CRE_10199 [Caenorhabditis remanei]|uniref:Uncharacterized protein n=1 Tax=Caenorhabditis remanei TaxID=31234 RepID=E3M6V9_CAERE|nr:hypothetical protein CRE_10199 [Caenorhabditis remanei]